MVFRAKAPLRNSFCGGGTSGAGHLLLYCPISKGGAIVSELGRLGGQVVAFAFEGRGLQTWRVHG